MLACIFALASYGAYQTFWAKSTPQTLAGAVPCPSQIVSQCSDASAAINAAISIAVTQKIPLYIDQPYVVNSTIRLVSNLNISAAPGACLIQNTALQQPAVGQLSNTSTINNVIATNLQVCVNANSPPLGDAFQLNVANSRFYNPTVNYTSSGGAPAVAGNAFTITSTNSQFYGPNFATYCSSCTPSGSISAAAGGFVWQGCVDSQVIGGFGISQGATWQFAPVSTGTGIVRCRFESVGGQSNGAEFFTAELPAGTASKAASAYPSSSSGTGTGYDSTNQTILTATDGVCTLEPQFMVTQANPPTAGAVTQVSLWRAGQCSTPVPSNPLHTSSSSGGTGATLYVNWVNADATANCIIDSGISGAPGQIASGRGLTISNAGSSGGQCPGRPPIDGLTISNVTLDDSADQASAQTISVSGADFAHPVGAVTFDSVSVPNPYTACADVSGPVRSVVFNHPNCGRSHLGLVGYLTNTAVTGATTLSVATPQCLIIESGDQLGIALDDNAAANGSYAGKQQIVSTTGCQSGNTSIGLGAGLLGTASGGGTTTCCLGAIYDYSEQVYNLSMAQSGSMVFLQSVAQVNASDHVILICNDGSSVSTTVTSTNPSNNSVLLGSSCSSGANAGNQFVDRSKTSSHPMFTAEGVRGMVLNQPVIRGADASVLSFGPAGQGSPAPSSDVAVNDARLLDISAGSAGIAYSNCDFCPMKGGSVTATAGSSSSHAASFSTTQPVGTDYVAHAFTSSNTTPGPLSTEDFALFNYVHSFYAWINHGGSNQEIVHVTNGMGSPTWTVVGGQLGTAAGQLHNVGEPITLAQSGTTDSPLENVDIGDLGATSPLLAVTNYQAGQGNDIESLQGVDWQATQMPVQPNFPYFDTLPQINLTTIGGSGAIIQLVSFSASMPPFKTKCQRWYNTTSSLITVTNGNGIYNTGGAALPLTSHSFGEWCLDPGTQALYQLGGSNNS
ncbi:MAG TPA: hypothetical protein VKR31_13860 [Rhizomicrobium sp.]|nr:hypothetical protein [Rhizomicrobium sp.]